MRKGIKLRLARLEATSSGAAQAAPLLLFPGDPQPVNANKKLTFRIDFVGAGGGKTEVGRRVDGAKLEVPSGHTCR